MLISSPAAGRESRRRWALMVLIIKYHLLCFTVVFRLQPLSIPCSAYIFVTVGAAKCWFRCARVLCRVPLSKCSFAEHVFTPRNASVKSTRGAKPARAAGRTKSLTSVLQTPNEKSRRGKKPTVFPGQAGWWQCTEIVWDVAWFLDRGNSSLSCAMWEWVYPGEDFSTPGESDRSPTGC